MIALHSDSLLFQLANGESVPCSAEMITVEIVGEENSQLDAETLRHAAASVFHYFKHELDRELVTVGEFSQALERVLTHLGFTISAGDVAPAAGPTDLSRLAREAGPGCELYFFPRLRQELRGQLRQSARVVCAAASKR
jgi:diphthamide synthase (EF-2-diphthine--ammonia ligase)